MEINTDNMSKAGTMVLTWAKIGGALIGVLFFIDNRYATKDWINEIRLHNGRQSIEENIEELARDIGEMEAGEMSTQGSIQLSIAREKMERLKRDIEWLHVEVRK